MSYAAIGFPQIDPIIFQIGPFALRWYALAYIAGLLLGWRYAVLLVSRRRYWPVHYWDGPARLTREHLDDLLLWAALGIILGGRLGYVLFYNFSYYLDHPAQALAVWRGGMSFHGGLIGIVLAILAFSHARRVNPFIVGDIVSAAGTIGLFFGRIANFINAELFGRTSDVPWAFVFPGAGPLPRHPSQLYEAALEGIGLFILLYWLISAHKGLAKPGLVTGLFFVGYAVSRIFVEFFRMPDAHIGYLWGPVTMGMVLSLPMILIGLGFVAFAHLTARSVKGAKT